MADGTTGSVLPGTDGERIARAAHGQQLVWATGRLAGGRLLQHVTDTFRIGAAVDRAQLSAAFAELAARHTALRTSVRVLDGGLRQFVQPRIDLPVEFADLGGADDGKRAERLAELAERLAELAEQTAALPFDPARAPLWRAVAVRLDAAGWAVVLVAHQLVCDQASLFLLNAELAELCAALEQGRAPVLPEQPLDFAGHADRQHDRSGAELRLSGSGVSGAGLPGAGRPGHGLPLDRPRPAVPAFVGAEVRSELPPGLTAALRAGSDRLAAAPFLLLAGYAALLHGRSGRTAHAIGVPVSGRHRPETRSLVGALAGTAVLHLDTAGDPVFAELVERARAAARAAWDHPDRPFPRDADRPDDRPDDRPGPHHPGLTLTEGRELGAPCAFAEQDLLLDVADRAARLVYDTALFTPATARGLLDDFLALLAAGLADPATPLSRLPAAAANRRNADHRAADHPAADHRPPGDPTATTNPPTGPRGPADPQAPCEGRAAPSVLLRSTP
ncbi:condensation domain-containing protein [Kitasatospora sp. NPDC089797]|uniref:condensation domain-containing protein n=1 Tax=Kitasatospora sp. NPDC089797 TaxID=3155298 RepID=UPI003446F810